MMTILKANRNALTLFATFDWMHDVIVIDDASVSDVKMRSVSNHVNFAKIQNLKIPTRSDGTREEQNIIDRQWHRIVERIIARHQV